MKAKLAASSNRVRYRIYTTGFLMNLGYEATISCDKEKEKNLKCAYIAQSIFPCSQDDLKDKIGRLIMRI